MKKTIGITFIFICVCTQTFGQFTVGAKAGLNMSRGYTSIKPLSSDIKFKPGVHAGGFINYRLASKLQIQTEFIYSQEGYKSPTHLIEYNGNVNNDGYKITLHYLNVPLLLKYKIGKNG